MPNMFATHSSIIAAKSSSEHDELQFDPAKRISSQDSQDWAHAGNQSGGTTASRPRWCERAPTSSASPKESSAAPTRRTTARARSESAVREYMWTRFVVVVRYRGDQCVEVGHLRWPLPEFRQSSSGKYNCTR